MNRLLRGRTLVLCAFSAATACTGSMDELRAPFSATIPVGAHANVAVSNTVGEIRVQPADGSAVQVHATKYAPDRAALDNIVIETQRTGDGVAIATRYRGDHAGGVRYDVVVPRGVSVRIVNTVGAVKIGAVDGNVVARTSTGSMDVRLGRVEAPRRVDLRTVTGTLHLTIGGDSAATVSAATTVGSISSAFRSVQSSRTNVVGASASGAIGPGGATVRLTVGTGAIAIDRS